MSDPTHAEFEAENARLAAENKRLVAAVPATQTAHPGRAVVRTIVAVAVSAAVLLPLILPVVLDWAAEQAWLPSDVTAGIAAVTTVVVAVAGLITRLLAVPGVDRFLSTYVPFLSTGAPSTK